MILNAWPELSTWCHGTRTSSPCTSQRTGKPPQIWPLSAQVGCPTCGTPARTGPSPPPKQPGDVGEEPGAAAHAAAVGYKREPGQPRHK